MSCDGNRGKFFAHAAQHKAVQDAFGSQAEAEAGLEQIFNTARARAVSVTDRSLVAQAEARTRKLFVEMKAADIKPPTHSPSGLPRRDAQFGYSAVQQALEAMRSRKAIPALTRQVLEKAQRTRQISSVAQDAGGYMRCGNCGRFAARSGGHLCPATASKETLGKHLTRRFGIPDSAYGEGLDALLSEARTNGTLLMRHGLTGETVNVSLDGLPLALSTGFVPGSWAGKTAAVELTDGRVIQVLDATSLNPIQPSGSALGTASAAYGLVTEAETLAGSALSIPPVSYHSVITAAQTDVAGGQEYDMGHFAGTEYRKHDALGTEIEVNGVPYKVGSRSQDPSDWSSARIAGIEPAPKGGVAVGRTLVEAVGILSEGEVVETADGNIQVYSAERRELLSVFDPATSTAGDTLGTPNASPAQMAAVLAHRALHPQDQFDVALSTDLARARNRTGTPLAAADSAYIAMKNSAFSSGKTLHLGGTVSAGRCPNCGRFKGDAHICPNASKETDAATSTTTSAPAFETPSLTQPSVNVDVQVDTSPIAEAMRNAAPVVSIDPSVQVDTTPIADAMRNAAPAVVSIDSEAFAQAMQAINIPASVASSAASTSDMSELKSAMTQMAQAIESLAKKSGPAKDTRATERLVEVTEKLAASVAGSGTPLAASSSSSGRCPKCGQSREEGHTCPPRKARQGKPVTPAEQRTAQEHMFESLTLAAPDPYLLNVPENVGGQLQQPLEEFIPLPDPNFEINEQTDKIMSMISSTMQVGANRENMSWTRSIGLYGPPGTGKNTIARQIAASIKTVDGEGNLSQGMNYVEANITPESSMQELIGTTVLEKDPETGTTVSRTRLGKIGLAAAMGSVVCINEIVRNPKLATALQSMLEDGEIQIDSPEQGMIRIPVHPSSVFVMTWNPGMEGDAERPGQAPLSRMMPLRMDRASADEQARRVESFFANVRGEKTEVDSIGARRKEILARDYSIPKDITPSQEEIKTSVRFFGEVATLTGGGIGERQIGLNSDSSTAPGQRQLNRFIALGKTVGWNDALETLKISCDQDDQFDNQWSLIRERFEAHFGADGDALNRAAPNQN